MSKALIDLSRANAPRNTDGEVPAQTPRPSRKSRAEVTEPPKTVAATDAVSIPASQPVINERLSTIGARIPESLHHTIKMFCIGNRIEMQQFVQDALSKHLAELQSGQA